MANLKISELPYLANIQEPYEFAIVNNAGTPETQKVTITGMTFQGGNTYFDAITDFTPSSPFTIVGSGTSTFLTGTTINIKRFEANSIITATILLKSDSTQPVSYFYFDVDAGNTSPNFYLPLNYPDTYASVTYTWRGSNLGAGSHTVDLYVNLENSSTFNFGQIVLTWQEI